ncbi:DNA-formamidopyrimidine glycosylase family protein [Streptomyces violaceorubidus]
MAAVRRHGKFLAVATAGGPQLVTHLARAGWLQWKDRPARAARPSPGKGPLWRCGWPWRPARAFDLTEAGTQKRLAVYVVARPAGRCRAWPGSAPTRSPATSTRPASAALLGGGAAAAQGRAARPEPDRGRGQRVQRRDPARGEDVPVQTGRAPSPTRRPPGCTRRCAPRSPRRSSPLPRASAAGRLKAEKKGGLRVHGRAGEPCPVCGDTIREVSFSDSSLQHCRPARPAANRWRTAGCHGC